MPEAPKTVLVLEDDPVLARVLQDFLSAHGYRTVVERSGPAGLDAFDRESPSMMLIDVMLPRKSGFEVCFEIKRTERGQKTPVILMSAVYTDEAHAKEYTRTDLRAQGYLVKPFDLDALLDNVRFFIGPA